MFFYGGVVSGTLGEFGLDGVSLFLLLCLLFLRSAGQRVGTVRRNDEEPIVVAYHQVAGIDRDAVDGDRGIDLTFQLQRSGGQWAGRTSVDGRFSRDRASQSVIAPLVTTPASCLRKAA